MLNMQEFGKRVQAIREQVLNMSQSELAEKINTSQVLLSRIENGIGSINVLFDLVNYLNSKNIAAKEIFSKQFSIDRVVQVSSNPKKARTQVEKMVKKIQESLSADLDKLLLMLPLQEKDR